MSEKTYLAVVYREDDLYVAECPEIGTASNGETIEEALAMLKEATEAYLEAATQPNNGHTITLATITVKQAS